MRVDIISFVLDIKKVSYMEFFLNSHLGLLILEMGDEGEGERVKEGERER